MDRFVKLTIPVKPHLKAYLADFFEIPYVLSQKDHMGLFIFQILRRRKFKDRRYFNIDSCTDSFEVLVSKKFTFNLGCRLMHDYQVHLINCYLEDMMMDHAITWVRSAEFAGMSNKEAIYKWIDMYQLDEGSSDWYHRIKKKYFRFRKNKGNTPKIGAPCVP
jgi:hypothetical protein